MDIGLTVTVFIYSLLRVEPSTVLIAMQLHVSNGNEMEVVNISILQEFLKCIRMRQCKPQKSVFQEGVDICKCLVEKRVKLLQCIHIMCIIIFFVSIIS